MNLSVLRVFKLKGKLMSLVGLSGCYGKWVDLSSSTKWGLHLPEVLAIQACFEHKRKQFAIVWRPLYVFIPLLYCEWTFMCISHLLSSYPYRYYYKWRSKGWVFGLSCTFPPQQQTVGPCPTCLSPACGPAPGMLTATLRPPVPPALATGEQHACTAGNL